MQEVGRLKRSHLTKLAEFYQCGMIMLWIGALAAFFLHQTNQRIRRSTSEIKRRKEKKNKHKNGKEKYVTSWKCTSDRRYIARLLQVIVFRHFYFASIINAYNRFVVSNGTLTHCQPHWYACMLVVIFTWYI